MVKSNVMLRTILFLSISFLTLVASGQTELTTKSKRATKLYDEGKRNFTLRYYKQAELSFLDAIKADPQFIEAYLVLAEVYWDQSKNTLAIETYDKAIAINPDYYPRAFLNKGRLELKEAMYKEGLESLERYLTYNEKNVKLTEKAKQGIQNARFAIHAIENPVPFDPVNMGPAINTTDDEYWPSFSADGKTLVITRMVGSSNKDRFIQEDFFYSTFDGESWSEARDMGKPLNTPDNEGAQSISANGKVMVYTVCNRRDVIGRCDIYISKKKGEHWTPSINIGPPINSTAKETQPSLSSNGKTIFFASNRPGGKGGLDIWMSEQDENGQWKQPVNLGDSVNTPGDEMSPFIHFDNKTLYFASDYKTGMGGFDIFIVRKDTAENWTDVKNMGYPINTHRDEIGLVVNTKGDMAYYASGMNEENGKDIFQFELYREGRPIEVSYLKGKVFDAESRQRLVAQFELHDLKEGKIVNKSYSDQGTGEFLICIPTDRNYMLNVSKPGYLFYSENFALEGVFDLKEPFHKDVPLQPIRAGEAIVLKNVFFETDSYALKDESKYELNKIVRFLQDNPTIRIEISGHTDNIGTASYNQDLSENRAKSVVDYLIAHEIAVDRLEHKGYGLSQPIDSNDTEAGRANNRRTELKVVE